MQQRWRQMLLLDAGKRRREEQGNKVCKGSDVETEGEKERNERGKKETKEWMRWRWSS